MFSRGSLALCVILLTGCGRLLGSAPPRPSAPSTGNQGSAWQNPNRAPVGEAVLRRGVLQFARAQLGKPYCWGGAGPSCFDCSGLVSSAWQQAGIALPRTSEAMVHQLREVPLLEAREGDILHWPGHVGLYAGDGQVIDAGATRQLIAERRVWGVPRVLRAFEGGT